MSAIWKLSENEELKVRRTSSALEGDMVAVSRVIAVTRWKRS
jgi:hypothetical protein